MRFLYFAIVLLLYSCSSEDDKGHTPLDADFLVGSWQLNGSKISAGGPLPKDFTPILNGHVYTFGSDSNYQNLSENGTIISEGTFLYQEEELFFEPENNTQENFSFSVQLQSGNMIWSPTGPYLCIEGCLYRYEKLN